MTLNAKEVLGKMQKVDGWFTVEEGQLLLDSCAEAVHTAPSKNIVEIGSFKGRSTVVLGSVAKHAGARVWSIDPHEGSLTGPNGAHSVPPTFDIFTKNIAGAGLTEVVTSIREKSSEAKWNAPIAYLFIDGLHDYQSVFSDYSKYAPFIERAGLLAFHDYCEAFAGVKRAVDEVISSMVFVKKAQARNLIVFKR